MIATKELIDAVENLSERQTKAMISAFERVDALLMDALRAEDDEKSIYRLQGSSRVVRDYLEVLNSRLEGK